MDVLPRCWGIGLGRTGTNSLCQAFVALGYKNVVHNPTFEQLKYMDAGADNGVTLHFKYLDYKFPGSKFVLTLRDLSDWLPSMEYIAIESPVVSRDEDLKIHRRMTLYDTVKFERNKFVDAYHRHHADVRRYFSGRENDLLEMRIVEGEGWEKLCPFLDLPVPDLPFPHAHARHRTAVVDSPFPPAS